MNTESLAWSASVGSRCVASFDALFEKLVARFVTLLKSCGLSVSGVISDHVWARWKGVSGDHQREIIQHVTGYLDLLDRIRNDGVPLYKNKQVLWQGLFHLNLRPTSDLIDFIDEEDVIEIYNRNHVQIFRNLRFFELCSYPVADVLVFDWPSLYSREPDITDDLRNFVRDSFETHFVTRAFKSPTHVLMERFSERRKRFLVTDRILSPLWDRSSLDSKPNALLATKQVVEME